MVSVIQPSPTNDTYEYMVFAISCSFMWRTLGLKLCMASTKESGMAPAFSPVHEYTSFYSSTSELNKRLSTISVGMHAAGDFQYATPARSEAMHIDGSHGYHRGWVSI